MAYQPLMNSNYSMPTHKEQDPLQLQLAPTTASSMNMNLSARYEENARSLITMATPAATPPMASTSDSTAIGNGHDYVQRLGTPSSAKFRGMVDQQNGHWGTQIYADHIRIWLGTFQTERKAAMAYDSTALKLNLGVNMHRNFPLTEITVHEPRFQKLLTLEEMLTMIRNGLYKQKFIEFLNLVQDSKSAWLPITSKDNNKYMYLFDKELTPSDVGKLNRLVVPKKFAERYFPPIAEHIKDSLVFKDREGHSWSFKYSYWPSSQSYVFTTGWSTFVNRKHLETKDKVLFYWCEEERSKREYIIDVVKKNAGDVREDEEEEEVVESAPKKLKLFGFWVA